MNTNRPMENKSLDRDFRIMMEDHKSYLFPGISLADIASGCSTNVVYVTRYIKDTYNQSFYEYINKKRIEYSFVLMQKYRNSKHPFTITGVALECGYSGLAGYRNNLKRFYNLTTQDLKDKYCFD